MSNTKYTPKSWEARALAGSDGRVEWSVYEDGLPIAQIECDGNEEANAKAIACLPELLEMLQRFIDAGEGNPSDKQVVDLLPWDDCDKLMRKVGVYE